MNAKTIYIILGVVVIGAIIYYISTRPHDNPSGLVDSNGNTSNLKAAIKCCTARDKFCHCTAWKWSASKDCESVGCGGGSGVVVNPNVGGHGTIFNPTNFGITGGAVNVPVGTGGGGAVGKG